MVNSIGSVISVHTLTMLRIDICSNSLHSLQCL